MADSSQPQAIGDILKRFNPLRDKFISREFQKYGYDLAMELGDPEHKALYIKLAKEVPRAILEKARYFVKDAKARSKAKLFMWKVSELKKRKMKAFEKGYAAGFLDVDKGLPLLFNQKAISGSSNLVPVGKNKNVVRKLNFKHTEKRLF